MNGSGEYNVTADLILEAGVSLTFNSGSQLLIGNTGSLKAVGTEAEPILFTGFEKIPGYLKGIEFNRSNSINNQLDYVTVEYAGLGDALSSGSIMSLCFTVRPTRLSVTNSIIKDSLSWGVYRGNIGVLDCNTTLSNNTYSNNASGDVNIPVSQE